MKVILTGASGMLGSSITKAWDKQRPDDELVVLNSSVVDLRNREETLKTFESISPQAVIHAAAVVAGIEAKVSYPTKYLLDNLLIDTSVISSCIQLGIKNFLYIGSAAIYPENMTQPLRETDLLSGKLEKENEGYALSKIVGLKLCEYASKEFGYSYRTVVPSNIYGPNENYSLSEGHLIAAIITKVSRAKELASEKVAIWGDGKARREFIYSEDFSNWIVEQIGNLEKWPVFLNVGNGIDYSVEEYYQVAKEIINYEGSFEFDISKPTGVSQRLLDSTIAQSFGWSPTTSIREGMSASFQSFIKKKDRL